jgi:vacuolar-type H+-ATPase subunit E/Vma4
MALGDLLAAISRDADAEVHRTLAPAEQDAAQIDADTARYCSARLAEAMRDLTARERTKHTVRLVEVEHRHRRAILEARAAMLERLREAVRARLPALVDDALRARFVAAASAYGEGTRRDVPTGVVIELDDGTRIEASLETTLDTAWPRLAGEALALIEGRRP